MNVYDFDNTIYDGESTFDFFVYCARKYPALLRFLPRVLVVVARYKMCRISREELFSLVAKYQAEFLKIAGDIRELSREFWDRNMHKIKDFYKKSHRADDVIVSASFGFLLDEAAQRLGVRHLICSQLDLNTGRVLELCFAESKPDLFAKRFPGEVIDNFYTDSLNDISMIRLAKNAFIVKGNKIKEYTD